MGRTLVGSAIGLGLALGLAAPAGAVSITQTYSFVFTSFIDVGGLNIASPLSAIAGSFTLTFDPDVYVDNDTTDIVVNYLTGAVVDSPIGFDNFPSAGVGQPGYLAIGGVQFDADFISFGTNDFALNLVYFDPAHPHLALCSDGYACGTAPGSTIASGYTLAGYPDSGWLVSVGGGVPEPASWALMIAGLGLTGGALRRRAALQHG
jgi:hypothetical protein